MMTVGVVVADEVFSYDSISDMEEDDVVKRYKLSC
jgi:hypothetical protein